MPGCSADTDRLAAAEQGAPDGQLQLDAVPHWQAGTSGNARPQYREAVFGGGLLTATTRPPRALPEC